MDFSFMKDYWALFLGGMKVTLLISFFTVIFGTVFGTVLSLFRISSNPILKGLAATYTEFIRGTPIMVQLFIVYYGLPAIGIEFPKVAMLGDGFSDMMAGVVALSINSSAYVSEIIRAGIQAVDKGQMEASLSLGMTEFMAMKHVILPQAFKNILPALGNEFITIIKESSIVSVIGIQELMYNADTVRGNLYKPFEPLLIAAFMYFVMTFTLSKIMGLVEGRLKTSD